MFSFRTDLRLQFCVCDKAYKGSGGHQARTSGFNLFDGGRCDRPRLWMTVSPRALQCASSRLSLRYDSRSLRFFLAGQPAADASGLAVWVAERDPDCRACDPVDFGFFGHWSTSHSGSTFGTRAMLNGQAVRCLPRTACPAWAANMSGSQPVAPAIRPAVLCPLVGPRLVAERQSTYPAVVQPSRAARQDVIVAGVGFRPPVQAITHELRVSDTRWARCFSGVTAVP